jgi:Concanavalin A-like lectin/glucanases superfamily
MTSSKHSREYSALVRMLLGVLLLCTAARAASAQSASCEPTPYLTGVGMTDVNRNPVSVINPNSDYLIHVCGKVSSTCLTVTAGADPATNMCLDNGFSNHYVFGDIGETFYHVRTDNSGTALSGFVTPWDSCSGAQPQFNMSIGSPGPDGCAGVNAISIPPAGLHLWLRADTGLVFGSGTNVFQWLDQSGNGRNARMATVARQPSFVSFVSGALNGQPVVRFSGAQSMYLDVFTQPTTFSVFVVGKNSLASESFSMILGPGGNSPNDQLRWENGSQTLFVTGNAQTVRTSPIGNTRAYHALSARYDGSTMGFYRDGSFMSSTTFSSTAPWTIASIGSWYSTYFMVGDLAEVIVYDRALSETERASVNSYLRSKYGLP